MRHHTTPLSLSLWQIRAHNTNLRYLSYHIKKKNHSALQLPYLVPILVYKEKNIYNLSIISIDL